MTGVSVCASLPPTAVSVSVLSTTADCCCTLIDLTRLNSQHSTPTTAYHTTTNNGGIWAPRCFRQARRAAEKAISTITFVYTLHIHRVIEKKQSFKKFSGFWMGTVCPMRLSFSQFNLLMSTPNCEKDSLIGQVLHVQNQSSIFGQFGFFQTPFKVFSEWSWFCFNIFICKCIAEKMTIFLILDQWQIAITF